MNCLSINIRGIGITGKGGWIKKLKDEFGVSFIGMQETMCGNLQEGVLSNFWGGLGFEFDVVHANGNSGVLLVFGILRSSRKTAL